MGILLQVEYSKVHSNDSSNAETTKDLTRWEGPMIILTVILNISLTIAISGRIWWKYRKLARLLNDRTQRRHFQTVWLAVESGVVIAITQIVLLILGALSSPGYQIIAHAVTPLIGIAFTGIILRVQLSPRDCDYSIETGALDTIVPTTVDDAIIQEVTPASDYELRRITFDAKTSELDLCESRVESTEPP
ncbi:hypothetical protein C8Q75DRAFT_801930 [Abortiporus biennis]|nr:hypothetical protein C8Q75DRAFT_801930 [Abortiporus biennis]